MLKLESQYVCFRYEDPQDAKRAWERVAKRCRNLSVNRIAAGPTVNGPQYVIALAEDEAVLAKAKRLMEPGGKRVEPPAEVVQVTMAKRVRNMVENEGQRIVIRSPSGNRVTTSGIDLGPVRRPQG